MTLFQNGIAVSGLAALLLASGCASNRCNETQAYLGMRETAPLVIPEGVTAPQDSGAYRLPPRTKEAQAGCLAEPPMTLPSEMLLDPEDREEAPEEGVEG